MVLLGVLPRDGGGEVGRVKSKALPPIAVINMVHTLYGKGGLCGFVHCSYTKLITAAR